MKQFCKRAKYILKLEENEESYKLILEQVIEILNKTCHSRLS